MEVLLEPMLASALGAILPSLLCRAKGWESTCCHQYSQLSIYILRMNNAPEVNPNYINPDQVLTGHFSVSLLLQLLTPGLST